MAIRWNAELLRDICILPTAVADNELRFASAPQLKVLLWVAAHEKENVDCETCAAALHIPLETVTTAIAYWADRGVFVTDGVSPAAPAQVQETPVEPTVPVARPTAVKPQMQEVIRRQKECKEFSALLEDVSARLGKPLSHGDCETLLYLYDTAGMNATVIIMAVGYAVSRNKYSMRYIEKVLLGWQDEGITTIDAADEHLRLLEQTDIAAEKVRTLLGRAKELDARQRQMAHTWVFIWQFSDEMIALALEKAKTKAGAVIPYAHKVLAGWYEENITDVAAANKETESKAPAARRGKTEATSLDVKGYESLLEDYVPTIPRKE